MCGHSAAEKVCFQVLSLRHSADCPPWRDMAADHRIVTTSGIANRRFYAVAQYVLGTNSAQLGSLRPESGPDPSAQSVGRAARLSRNVRQPNRVLANGIGGNKAERWPWAGKEWLAATKHDGVEVESILIDKTKIG